MHFSQAKQLPRRAARRDAILNIVSQLMVKDRRWCPFLANLGWSLFLGHFTVYQAEEIHQMKKAPQRIEQPSQSHSTACAYQCGQGKFAG